VGRVLATRTTAEWLETLGRTSVPTMIVNRLEDLLGDPHLVETGFWQSYDHPSEGRLRGPGIPTRFFATPGSVRRHAPRLGEHSREVLREAGLSEAEIAAMLASRATTQAD